LGLYITLWPLRARLVLLLVLLLALFLVLAHLLASVTRPCCRLGPPSPRYPTLRLVVLQERRSGGRLTTRPRRRPRPRLCSARCFLLRGCPGRLRMHARWPCLALFTSPSPPASSDRCSFMTLTKFPLALPGKW
jgi:hypothetical protein